MPSSINMRENALGPARSLVLNKRLPLLFSNPTIVQRFMALVVNLPDTTINTVANTALELPFSNLLTEINSRLTLEETRKAVLVELYTYFKEVNARRGKEQAAPTGLQTVGNILFCVAEALLDRRQTITIDDLLGSNKFELTFLKEYCGIVEPLREKRPAVAKKPEVEIAAQRTIIQEIDDYINVNRTLLESNPELLVIIGKLRNYLKRRTLLPDDNNRLENHDFLIEVLRAYIEEGRWRISDVARESLSEFLQLPLIQKYIKETDDFIFQLAKEEGVQLPQTYNEVRAHLNELGEDIGIKDMRPEAPTQAETGHKGRGHNKGEIGTPMSLKRERKKGKPDLR
jgi:hypothetical protein